jgi:hypothetical protein
MDDHFRASEADRDRVAVVLRVHYAAGRLTPSELDDRLAAALAAATLGDLRRALAGLPEPEPGPPHDSRLERRYRRLMAFFPARYRRVHEEEILTVLMTAAPEGKSRPSLADAADLILGALRVRCQPVRGGLAGPGWRGILALMSTGAAAGLLAGAGYAVHDPPLRTSRTLILLPLKPDARAEALSADSRPVLVKVLHSSPVQRAEPGMSLQTLRSRIQVQLLSSNVILITAQGKTTAEAVGTANAAADSYIQYADNASRGNRRLWPEVLDPAAIMPGTPLLTYVLATSGLGALCGTLLGALGAVVLSPPRRRVRMT